MFVDGFEKLFLENGQAKIFEYKVFKITFYLKLVAKDLNYINGNEYKKYWIGEKDFNFFVKPFDE